MFRGSKNIDDRLYIPQNIGIITETKMQLFIINYVNNIFLHKYFHNIFLQMRGKFCSSELIIKKNMITK